MGLELRKNTTTECWEKLHAEFDGFENAGEKEKPEGQKNRGKKERGDDYHNKKRQRSFKTI